MADANTFTIQEIQEIQTGVLGPTILNRNDPERLEDEKTPDLNLLLGTGQLMNKQPTDNKVASICRARRRQRIQWWNGADLLAFEAHAGTFLLKFNLGQGHMGDELLFDFLRHFGVKIDYSDGINGGHSQDATMTIMNIIKENEHDLREAFRRDLAKSLWRSNAGNTKAFLSLTDLFPATTNSVGTIGEKSRTNPLLRHQLMTGITIDNIQLKTNQMVRAMTDQALNGSPNLCFCGDNVYDVWNDLWMGTSTRQGKGDMRAKQDAAYKMGEKYNVTLPQDCFADGDRLYIRVPLWNEIDDEENPTVPLKNQMRMFNTRHVGFEQIRDGEGANDIKHPVPYNQRLQRRSKHGEWVVHTNRPGAAAGVMVLN